MKRPASPDSPRTRPVRPLVASILSGTAREDERRFTATFTVGSADACGIQLIDPGVADAHVQVVFDGVRWWARNLAGAGTYLAGAEIQMVPLQGRTELEVGKGGPVVSLTVGQAARDDASAGRSRSNGVPGAGARTNGALPAKAAAPSGKSPRAHPPRRGFGSEEEIVARLRASDAAPAGQQTMMMRRAFATVQRTSSRKYQVAIGTAAAVLLAAGGVIWHQQRRLAALRSTAEEMFYATKSLELQAAKLEELVLLRADPRELAELKDRRAKLGRMEHDYDAFVRELGVYAKASPQERVVLRVARRFGECDVNLPRGFVAEVERHVARWRATGRLAAALQRAEQRGYAAHIGRTFEASNLPSQYIFLALQESAFDERAIGPPTRHGIAKGMWQFIPATGQRYGLRIGPRHGERAYDAQDERFDWRRATGAAARYIRDLVDTEAQGSGLLVMASYNWGEHNLRAIIEKLPPSPQERNFWRLLADKRVPRETYDYVLSIFSAAVLCEEPKLFEFDGPCPRPHDPGATSGAEGRTRWRR